MVGSRCLEQRKKIRGTGGVKLHGEIDETADNE